MTIYLINNPVSDEVGSSVRSQAGVDNIEIVNGVFEELIPKRRRIAMSKEICRKLAIQQDVEFAVIHDDDLVHLNDNNILDMKNFLNKFESFGAVALSRYYIDIPKDTFYTRYNGQHVCSGVIMIRKNALASMNFGNSDVLPTCDAVSKSLVAAGWKYGYVDRNIRIKHMKRSHV